MEKKIIIDKMISKYRKQKGITMKELSEIVEKSEATVSMWESGKTQPRVGPVYKMAEYFGIEPTTLMFGETYEEEVQLEKEFSNVIEQLNLQGKKKLMEYAKDLCNHPSYKSN